MQSIGAGLGALLLMIAISLVARRASSNWRGVVYGIAVGVLGSIALSFVGGFLTHVLPIGQMDFYLARKLYEWGLIKPR